MQIKPFYEELINELHRVETTTLNDRIRKAQCQKIAYKINEVLSQKKESYDFHSFAYSCKGVKPYDNKEQFVSGMKKSNIYALTN